MRQLMLTFAIAPIAAAAITAQQPVPRASDANVPVSFEVASVKANTSGDPGGNIRRQPGGRVTVTGVGAGVRRRLSITRQAPVRRTSAVAVRLGFSGQAGRMVLDRTGLTGTWDFELTFTAEQRGSAPPGTDVPPPDPNAPSLFTALQEQLGLKLEATMGPVEVLVIDSADRLKEE